MDTPELNKAANVYKKI